MFRDVLELMAMKNKNLIFRRSMVLASALWLALFATSTFSSPAGVIQQVTGRDSVSAAGGAGDSFEPMITPDGRYILFASTANNLVTNGGSGHASPFPARVNVFRRDRQNGTTTLVSQNLAGVGGNADSIPTALSSDGRYALFESAASDLVAGDTNGVNDVFVRDILNHVTLLVSVSTNGGMANNVSRGSTMTPDGRFVAFTSEGNNLVPADTNGVADVFVRDLQTGTTTLASIGALPSTQRRMLSAESPEITPDGRYVAFFSTVPDSSGVYARGDIYVRDLMSSTTTWASQGVADALGGTNTISFNHHLSTNGQFVVFQASTNAKYFSSTSTSSILRFDQVTGITRVIHTNAYVQGSQIDLLRGLDLTPDGNLITFIARTNSTDNLILLWNATAQTTSLISANTNGLFTVGSFNDWPAIDSAGASVAFLSAATDLVTNSVAPGYHLYRRDLLTGVTSLVDATPAGGGGTINPSTQPKLSGAGHLVAFEAADGHLMPKDNNHSSDVFVRDVLAGTTELISAHDPSLPGLRVGQGPNEIVAQSASADGRFIVFTGDYEDPASGSVNLWQNVFVRDMVLGTNLLVSLGLSGAAANNLSSEPVISGNGRYVVFTSSASNLVPGDTNNVTDVFLADLRTGALSLVSVNLAGTGPGNQASFAPSISADGRFIVFTSLATTLSAGGNIATGGLFIRDTQLARTTKLNPSGVRLSALTPDGRYLAYLNSSGLVSVWDCLAAKLLGTYPVKVGVTSLAISPDGNQIVCADGRPGVTLIDRIANSTNQLSGFRSFPVSNPRLSFSAEGRFLVYAATPASLLNSNNIQVFLYDGQTKSEKLLSTVYGTNLAATGRSDAPDVNADGRLIVFRSTATNLLAQAVDGSWPQLYLFDRITGTTALLTTNSLAGTPADGRSLRPFFTPDGHTLLFQSWASDLLSQTSQHSGEVFELVFLYSSLLAGSNPGQGAVLHWPNRSGEVYHVQFKNGLGDPVWQEAGGIVTISGSEAQFIDPSPASGPRYYRVAVY